MPEAIVFGVGAAGVPTTAFVKVTGQRRGVHETTTRRQEERAVEEASRTSVRIVAAFEQVPHAGHAVHAKEHGAAGSGGPCSDRAQPGASDPFSIIWSPE